MKIKKLVLAALFAALTAAGAFIKIPFYPAMITLQLIFSLLAGTLLGPGLGAVSQLVYLAIGLAGIPVFAGGGGFGYAVQPTFGFVAALPLAAAVCGRISRRGESAREARFVRILIGAALGTLCVYAVGVPYMYCILNFYAGKDVTVWYTLTYGMLLYLPGDAVKCFAVAWLTPRLRRAL